MGWKRKGQWLGSASDQRTRSSARLGDDFNARRVFDGSVRDRARKGVLDDLVLDDSALGVLDLEEIAQQQESKLNGACRAQRTARSASSTLCSLAARAVVNTMWSMSSWSAGAERRRMGSRHKLSRPTASPLAYPARHHGHTAHRSSGLTIFCASNLVGSETGDRH